MAPSSIARCIPLGILVIGLAVGSAPGQGDSAGAKDEVLGGKLLAKLPYEVYRTPLFFETHKGTRLGVWVHETNPAPPFGFPGAPAGNPAKPDPKQKGNAGPPFELSIWDVAGGKELYHLKEKAAPPAYPSSGAMMFRAREPIHRIDYTPSGNNLISVQDSPSGMRIQLYDPQTHKSRSMPVNTGAAAAPGAPQALFAPNGDLVILDKTQCIVQDLTKSRTRRSFQIQRPGLTVTPRGIPLGLAVGFADAAIAPSGKTLAVSADGMVLIFDLTKGQPLWQLPKLSTAPGMMAARLAASLAFAPSAGDTKLLAVELVPDADKGNFARVSRYVDVKKKTELARAVLLEGGTFKLPAPGMPPGGKLGMRPPQWGRAYPYFNTRGEPRVIVDGKLLDPIAGRVLRQTDGHRYVVSRDGKYAVRLTQASPLDKTKMAVELWSVDRTR